MYLAKSLAEKLYLFQVMARPEGERATWSVGVRGAGKPAPLRVLGARVWDRGLLLALWGRQVNSL